MALFLEQDIRARYQKECKTRCFSATEALNESCKFQDSKSQFDIFLSHSSKDQELVLGLSYILQDFGYSVYVDWSDLSLDPNNVTPQTADILRKRMAQCNSLIYAFSENASNSKWMPWELGYFDALKHRVAVLPISKTAKSAFKGSEFVGLYYHIQIARIKGGGSDAIWVHDGEKYVNFKYWLDNKKPYQH